MRQAGGGGAGLDGLLVDGDDLDGLFFGDFIDHYPHELEVLGEVHGPADEGRGGEGARGTACGTDGRAQLG